MRGKDCLGRGTTPAANKDQRKIKYGNRVTKTREESVMEMNNYARKSKAPDTDTINFRARCGRWRPADWNMIGKSCTGCHVPRSPCPRSFLTSRFFLPQISHHNKAPICGRVAFKRTLHTMGQTQTIMAIKSRCRLHDRYVSPAKLGRALYNFPKRVDPRRRVPRNVLHKGLVRTGATDQGT